MDVIVFVGYVYRIELYLTSWSFLIYTQNGHQRRQVGKLSRGLIYLDLGCNKHITDAGLIDLNIYYNGNITDAGLKDLPSSLTRLIRANWTKAKDDNIY